MEAEKNVNSYWDNNGTSDGGSFQEEGGNITQDQENGTGTGFSASLDQNNIGQQHEQQGLLESVLWTFFPLSRSTLFLAAVIAMPWIYDFGTPWHRYILKLMSFYLSLTVVGLFVVIPASIWRPAHTGNCELPLRIFEGFNKIMAVDVNIEGLENLAESRRRSFEERTRKRDGEEDGEGAKAGSKKNPRQRSPSPRSSSRLILKVTATKQKQLPESLCAFHAAAASDDEGGDPSSPPAARHRCCPPPRPPRLPRLCRGRRGDPEMAPPAYVVVVNHQHALDLVVFAQLWLHIGHIAPVAKKEILIAGPFGLACYLCGLIFIDRSRGEEARRVLIESGVRCKREGVSMLVFPEGTRFHELGNRDMLPFKKGAFRAALASGMPILPVVISHYTFLDTSAGTFDPGHVIVRVLPPIEVEKQVDFQTEEEREAAVQRLTDQTRNVMLEEYRRRM